MLSSRSFLSLVLALGICFIVFSPLPAGLSVAPGPGSHSASKSPTINETLGFEKILALSRGTEWRLHGLRAAAASSGLDISVPKQPFVADELVDAFRQAGPDDVQKPSAGAAQAWMAHLDLLRYTVQSGLSTALIIEDDIDWSVEIKRQMTTLSDKVRQYTQAPDSDGSGPYGSEWDVLWLGHCGEWYDAADPPEILSWDDETSGPRLDWRGIYSVKWLQDLPEGQRHLFWSVSPICTYAYAVTGAGAQKILEWASDGQAEAYDIRLAAGCGSGALRCISVVDQLFHHYRPPVEFGQGSDIKSLNAGSAFASDGAIEKTMGSTAVILQSARCSALFGATCRDLSQKSERPYV